MLSYAAKMTRGHSQAGPEDIQSLRNAGFSDGDILHVIYWTAHFNMANTINDCVGLEVHENMTAVFADGASAAARYAHAIPQETLRAGVERAQVRALEGLPLEWINSPALAWADVEGRVLLVVYWDATHPNSTQLLPALRRWHDAYADRGVTIVACHAPEFPTAKDPAWARAEVARLSLRFPIVLDPTFRRIEGSNNRYWPAVHVIDRAGFARFRRYGPGGDGVIEEQIRRALADGHAAEPASTPSTQADAADRWLDPEASPDLYAGFYTGARTPELIGTEDTVQTFVVPTEIAPNQLYAQGQWWVRVDGLELAAAPGRIVFSYRSERVYLFASPAAAGGRLRVQVDGAAVSTGVGRDLVAGSEVPLDRPRLYELLVHPATESHRLEIETGDAGVRVHRLSFLPCRGDTEDG